MDEENSKMHGMSCLVLASDTDGSALRLEVKERLTRRHMPSIWEGWTSIATMISTKVARRASDLGQESSSSRRKTIVNVDEFREKIFSKI